MDKELELKQEIKFFDDARTVIKENITVYEGEYEKRHQETKELLEALHGGDVELYDRMVTSRSLEENAENQLRKNKAAWLRPFFGRIDFTDIVMKKEERLYIGKNGIFKNRSEILIADWRAPVSSVYYENEIGTGSYPLPDMRERKTAANFISRKDHLPDGEIDNCVAVDLHLKRTYDIEDGHFNGYYDSDVAANDDLLVKYLSKNKEVVLGEIIATIQKEQNAIIRESPFANLIVQGVAGSGKTTVAMHRMSYILYNYKDRFEANEFCVVGSNDLLLDYITGGLPELDVNKTKKLRMDELFIRLLRKEWKGKMCLTEDKADAGKRSDFAFFKKLEGFLAERKAKIVSLDAVYDERLGVLLTKSSNITLYHETKDYSAYRLLKAMDERILSRIKSLAGQFEQWEIKVKRKAYSRYNIAKFPKVTVAGLYLEFLETEFDADAEHINSVKKGCFDIYDIASMVLIYYRIFQKEPDMEFGLLFIDEAQDFGSGLYYVLKQVLPACYFTIMGDVSQNINYEAGMNDWEEVTSFFLSSPKDRFKILAKSYRNTIEISEYAGKILTKASSGQYRITPVIRHGMAVSEEEFWGVGETAERAGELFIEIKERGYQTIAVICRDDAEVEKVYSLLSGFIEAETAAEIKGEGQRFDKGIIVLPVRLTKGLEFDAVILWNPEKIDKLKSPKEAKLLYVATTRALHELYVLRY